MFISTYVKAKLILEDFKKDQRGVTAIEYAIIGVAIATIVGAVFATGDDDPLKSALDGAITTITGNM